MSTFDGMQNTTQATEQKKSVQFCPFCGTKLDYGARFCKNCGEAVSGSEQVPCECTQKKPVNEYLTERKTVFDGQIHKCPNCGEVLGAFLTVCPSCGHEIRDVKSTSSVREFALKLEAITAQKMPHFDEKKSVMKKVFGKDFKEEDEAEEAVRRFESQKRQEKIALIINYSVPNTKEDIMEFMILAASNIDVKKGVDDDLSKAWMTKLDQVYQKAEITMGGHPDFGQIKSIYDRKMNELKKKKTRGFIMGAAGVTGWFFLMGLLWNPVATILISVGIIIMVVIGYILLKKR